MDHGSRNIADESLLPMAAVLDPRQPSEQRAAYSQIPAKPAVYALLDAAGGVLLLSTVGDLRAALRRRLADPEPASLSKRVPFGQLACQLRYRVVHSPFAANWHYLRAARQLFPETFHSLITWRPPHWITIDSAEDFPQLERVTAVTRAAPTRAYFGPIPQRRAADRLIETLQDLFDLCRYHDILKLAPHGKACAYKDMGKCPAPCDGTVTMDHYRRQLAEALAFLAGPDDAVRRGAGYQRWRTGLEQTMKEAAAALDFERAARLKQKLGRAAILETPPLAWLDRLARFSYLALQPGQGMPYVEPFFIHGGRIIAMAPFHKKQLAAASAELFARCREHAAAPVAPPLSADQTQIAALVAHHLGRGDADPGIYLPTAYLHDAAAIETICQTFLAARRPASAIAEQSSENELHDPQME